MTEQLTHLEEQAFLLSKAAVFLDQARQKRDKDPAAMASALNYNLQLWVAIHSSVERDGQAGSPVGANLVRLSKFVADKTFAMGQGANDQLIDSLININLQLSEGLLEGAASVN